LVVERRKKSMARKEKHYLATFAPGTEYEVTYPVQGQSKAEAAEDFSFKYIGRVDSALTRLVTVSIQSDDDDEEAEAAEYEADDNSSTTWGWPARK
jgi:hypothetical protein